MKTYAVKEAFLTLQGEGGQAGRAAVFCRFTGCNLWTGREADRAKAHCTFCDTDFVGTDGEGGGRFSAEALADHLWALWSAGVAPGARGVPYIVFTGGEPTLQLDGDVIAACKAYGFELAIETNGTRAAPAGVDWICVSPKPGPELAQRTGQELKLVFPQSDPALHPARFAELGFERFFLQPLDGPERAANTAAAVAYCVAHPQWRLSIQTHKVLGIP